jgi:hypothetical protein
MRLRDTFVPLLGVVAVLALAGCGANPPAQAEPAAQSGIVLPTAPPMPTDRPQPPTPTPPPAPAAAVAPASALLLADDFAPGSNIQNWSVIDAAYALPGPSVWKLQNGRLIPYSDAQDLPAMYSTALVTGDPSWADYRVSAAGYVTTNDELGVVARASETGYYVFKLLPTAQKPNMVLARYDAAKGTFTALASGETSGFALGKWYTLGLSVQGDKLVGTLNGQEALTARDTTLKAGRAGVAAYAEGGLEFDNFVVDRQP